MKRERISLLRRSMKDDRGSSAIEFAIIAPVFLLLTALMVNGVLHLYAHSTIVVYAREAARGVALGYMTVEEASAFAIAETRGTLGVAAVINIEPMLEPSDQNVRVEISIAVDEMSRFAPFTALLPVAISTSVTMRSIK